MVLAIVPLLKLTDGHAVRSGMSETLSLLATARSTLQRDKEPKQMGTNAPKEPKNPNIWLQKNSST